jgi:glycosyltransferase involved in cell wall biosynthesis
MAAISANDVIRAIEKYYDGNLLRYMDNEQKVWSMLPMVVPQPKCVVRQTATKEINLVGNLNSKGGGEQSLYMIARLLQANGWKVNLHPWSTTNDKFKNGTVPVSPHSFKNGMGSHMVSGVPLLFYANDCIWDFAENAKPVVDKSSKVVIGINFMNGPLPKCGWLSSSHKLKAVIFQNTEKKEEWLRDAIGFNGTEYVVMFGAIDLEKYLEVCPPKRSKNDELVVLKHCMPDYRKWVTEESKHKGDKCHIWQKHFVKDTDARFYERLLKDTKNTRFEFMEAHKDLQNAFPNEPRMVFHKWDAMPVDEFLSRGHVYLYRTSNAWRDQYPRVIAEALAAGLPVLCEPRDGPLDRVVYGDTGAYCVDYDEFKEWVKKLQRKEDYRHHLGMNAKDWARENLDPRRWVDELERLVGDEGEHEVHRHADGSHPGVLCFPGTPGQGNGPEGRGVRGPDGPNHAEHEPCHAAHVISNQEGLG